MLSASSLSLSRGRSVAATAPHPIADARFNWIEPVVKKLGASA
jgi:hypothetical protein